MGAPSYEELCRLEPRLTELEQDVRAVRDDGQSSFFCSNFLWLPMNARLRRLVGVDRPEPDLVLGDSRVYEEAYGHLSRLMPPCRDCGCRLFDGRRTLPEPPAPRAAT